MPLTHFNLSFAFPQHRKTLELEAELGDSGIASLIRLLCHTGMLYAQEGGHLRGYSDAGIELAARWTGAKGKFTETLVRIGWLAKTEDGFQFQSWDEHNEHFRKYRHSVEQGRKGGNRSAQKRKIKGVNSGYPSTPPRTTPSTTPATPPSTTPGEVVNPVQNSPEQNQINAIEEARAPSPNDVHDFASNEIKNLAEQFHSGQTPSSRQRLVTVIEQFTEAIQAKDVSIQDLRHAVQDSARSGLETVIQFLRRLKGEHRGSGSKCRSVDLGRHESSPEHQRKLEEVQARSAASASTVAAAVG